MYLSILGDGKARHGKWFPPGGRWDLQLVRPERFILLRVEAVDTQAQYD